VEAFDLALAERKSAATVSQLARGFKAYRRGITAINSLDSDAALVAFQDSQTHLRPAGGSALGWAELGTARAAGYSGDYAGASRLLRAIATSAQTVGDRGLAGRAYWVLGWVHSREDRVSEALSDYKASLTAYRGLGEQENEGAVTHLMADSLFVQGEERPAWIWRLKSLELLHLFEGSLRLHNLLLESVRAAKKGSLFYAAATLYGEREATSGACQSSARLGESLRVRGELQAAQERMPEALESSQRAVETLRRLASSPATQKLLADALSARSRILLPIDAARSAEAATASLALYENLNTPWNSSLTLVQRSQAHSKQGDQEKAREDLQTATTLFETKCRYIRNPDARLVYSESVQAAYDRLLYLTWKRDPLESLRLLERARAQSVSDEPHSKPGPGTLDRVATLQRRMASNDSVVVYAELDEVLLIWLIEKERVTTIERAVASDKLGKLARSVNSGLAARAAGPALRALREISRVILPVELLAPRSHGTLYFIPDRSLNLIPFAALINPVSGRFLVEESAVALATSLGATAPDQPLRSGRREMERTLVVGDPAFDRAIHDEFRPLPGALEEAALAEAAFRPATVLRRDDATVAKVQRALVESTRFFYSGHAVFDERNPLDSYLLLASDPTNPARDRLTMRDIKKGSLKGTRLVVLSSCRSIGARSSRVGGLLGLAWAFLRSGAKVVMGSLSPLPDHASRALMGRFYDGVGRGLPVTQALRQAQMEWLRPRRAELAPDLSWANYELVL